MEKRISGVVEKLERGVANGLNDIADDMRSRIDSSITERFALIAGEVRLRLRKLESKGGKKAKLYDPLVDIKKPTIGDNMMDKVQNECQRLLDHLNHQVINAKNMIVGASSSYNKGTNKS